MRGFRIDYASGPVELVKAMEKFQSQSTSIPAAVSQAAAVAALNGPHSFFADWRNVYRMRCDRVVELLHGNAGLDCPTPRGAFYAYVSCANQIGKTTPRGKLITNDSDFVVYLLDDFKVATVQGAAYGISPAFRISFATSMDVIEKARNRITRACNAQH
jgi:aspartate aminotransferase